MQINLTVRKKGDLHSVTIPCDLGNRIIFGRNITSPAQFEGSEISREHFALFVRQGAVYIEDLSANGTLVNDKPVPQGRARKLGAGDVIGIPGYEIDLDIPGESSQFIQAGEAPTPAIMGKSLPPLAASLSFWELTIIGTAMASLGLILYYAMR